MTPTLLILRDTYSWCMGSCAIETLTADKPFLTHHFAAKLCCLRLSNACDYGCMQGALGIINARVAQGPAGVSPLCRRLWWSWCWRRRALVHVCARARACVMTEGVMHMHACPLELEVCVGGERGGGLTRSGFHRPLQVDPAHQMPLITLHVRTPV